MRRRNLLGRPWWATASAVSAATNGTPCAHASAKPKSRKQHGSSMGQTLFDKIWSDHVVRDLGGGWSLLHIDRHLLHDLSGPPALAEIGRRGLKVRSPELTFAVADHAVSSEPGRTANTYALGGRLFGALKHLAEKNDI